MKKKLNIQLLIMIILPIIIFVGKGNNIQALELKNTVSNCTLSEETCNKTKNCVYIDSKKCGIVTTENIEYMCYYRYYNSPTTIFLKAKFNAFGIVSVEIEHDIPMASKLLGKVTSIKEPITKTTNDRINNYYTCPSTLIEYDIEETKINDIDTTIRYYTPIVYEITNHNTSFELLEDKDYNGVMAMLPKGSKLPSKSPKNPLECTYSYEENNVKVSLIVTYIDDNTITVSELISANSGNDSGKEFDTSYIKKSEEFKNWKCAEQNKVYVAYDGEKKYISYNKEDLKDISNYFNELTGSNGPSNDSSSNKDSNLGKEQYGCNVVPREVKKWIEILLNFVKYVALILVVVLGTLDFIKAASSGEADSMKKAGQSFLKRVIAVIILFLLPMLVELILDLINLYGSKDCFEVLK